MNRKLISALAVAAVPTVAFLIGPRPDKTIQRESVDIPDDLDAYLHLSEKSIGDVFEGFEKQIHWANDDRRNTDLSIVYVHGFSASRFELSPLVEHLGDSLKANVFFTRLTGHGRPGKAMAAASVSDWINDGLEALEIGRRLGDRVLLVSNSTGSTIATWLAAWPELSDDVVANVMLSPNFGPKDGTSKILLWPWGGHIANLVQGRERSWEPTNELHGRYWTTTYPTSALVNMMGLVDLVAETNLTDTAVPTLVIYSDRDQVVDPEKIRKNFGRIGAPLKRLINFNESEDPSSHLLAGNVMSPSTTVRIRDIILEFMKPLQKETTETGGTDAS